MSLFLMGVLLGVLLGIIIERIVLEPLTQELLERRRDG